MTPDLTIRSFSIARFTTHGAATSYIGAKKLFDSSCGIPYVGSLTVLIIKLWVEVQEETRGGQQKSTEEIAEMFVSKESVQKACIASHSKLFSCLLRQETVLSTRALAASLALSHEHKAGSFFTWIRWAFEELEHLWSWIIETAISSPHPTTCMYLAQQARAKSMRSPSVLYRIQPELSTGYSVNEKPRPNLSLLCLGSCGSHGIGMCISLEPCWSFNQLPCRYCTTIRMYCYIPIKIVLLFSGNVFIHFITLHLFIYYSRQELTARLHEHLRRIPTIKCES